MTEEGKDRLGLLFIAGMGLGDIISRGKIRKLIRPSPFRDVPFWAEEEQILLGTISVASLL